MTYEAVFDVASAGYKSWPFPAFGLFFVALGTLLVLNRNALPAGWPETPKARRVFAFFVLGFAVFWTVTSFAVTYRDYRRLASAAANGSANVVEGHVTHFDPMPVTGHAMERFCVQGSCFEYSDYAITGGFNNTSSHGGPVREGLPVRVTYVGGAIIKLEVAR